MSLLLEDPRKYSNVFPESNILISQATADLANNDDNRLMLALIEDLLKQGQDQLLSVAYNLAPNKEVAAYIWNSIQIMINQPSSNKFAKLLALPLVLVVGSSTNVRLPESIDQHTLSELMIKSQIFSNSNSCYISGKLFDLDGIVKLKPSYMYHTVRNLDSIAKWDDSKLSHAAICNLGEGSYLRFLLCVAICEKGQPESLVEANYHKLGLGLMQLLTAGLKTEGATIFPLPFPFCQLSEAAVIGEEHRKEIHLTMRLSNQVKRIRQLGKTPEVKLLTSENEIKVELCVKDTKQVVEIIHWPLQRAEKFEVVCRIMADLFTDMQLEVSYVK